MKQTIREENSQGLVKQNISDVPNPSPPNEGDANRRKIRFCGPSNLNGQVPVVHSGTQEFYIGDEGEEEARIVVLFVFFRHLFPSFFGLW